jgi:hypothetical protein
MGKCRIGVSAIGAGQSSGPLRLSPVPVVASRPPALAKLVRKHIIRPQHVKVRLIRSAESNRCTNAAAPARGRDLPNLRALFVERPHRPHQDPTHRSAHLRVRSFGEPLQRQRLPAWIGIREQRPDAAC